MLEATYAYGDPELDTKVACPSISPGSTVTCTATGRAHTAQLRNVDPTHFVLTVSFAPPSGPQLPPRP